MQIRWRLKCLIKSMKDSTDVPAKEVLSQLGCNDDQQLSGRGLRWTPQETNSLIEAIRKHGRDWSKIVPLIPSRNPGMIRSMAQSLMIKFEKKPDLPDADILPILKDKTPFLKGDWTDENQQTLEKGIRENGKDLVKLNQLFPMMNITQIRWRVHCLQKKIESNPETTDEDLIREALKMTVESYGARGKGIAWTREETASLVEGIRKHGRDWPSVVPLIPTRNKSQICAMAQCLMLKFQKKPELTGSDILPILEERNGNKRWPKEEIQTLI